MKDKKIGTEPKSIMDVIEKIGIKYREATKKIQTERTKGNKIYVERTMMVCFNKNEIGHCDNVFKGEKRPKVKAGDDICSVGIIRKGRSWGDYNGVFCAECPYFIPDKRVRVVKEIRT
jgi:hypothetical protein